MTTPFDKYHDVQPIAIRNAGLLLREADKAVFIANCVLEQYEDRVRQAQKGLDAAKEDFKRAEYQLKISALQDNGGEA